MQKALGAKRALAHGKLFVLLFPASHGVTLKADALVAVPPGVEIAMFPVIAPLGTVATTCVSEFTVKVVAATPPKVTAVD